MATYYVDFVNGADANNGLGPDASAGTNKPWKTIAKLLGAAGMASGDTAYLAPGSFREVVTAAMTSAVATTSVIGDPQNKQGFKTSGGVAVDPGPVIWTAYTTNDKTAPSATALFGTAGRDYLSFSNILFVSGNARIIDATATSTNLTFTDCAFLPGYTGAAGGLINIAGANAVALNWTLDRCIFVLMTTSFSHFNISLPTASSGSDWDIGFVVKNSVFLGRTLACVTLSGSGGFTTSRPGGLVFRNNSVFGSCALTTTTTTTSITTIPCIVNNNFIYASITVGITAGTSGQITENYNLIVSNTPRTNVTAGANSISDGSYSPMFHFGQERLWGGPLFKMFGAPMQGSPLLGFGNDGSQSATDFLNLQRPAGGASASAAAGAIERHNNWITDTSPIGTGSSPIKITGPGDQAFLVPVPAAATTISVTVKWDATYAGTKPQLQIDANDEIGVSTETKTATGSSGSNETLTLSAFTPSKAGRMVTVRVKSNDTNGAGVLQADNFSVTA